MTQALHYTMRKGEKVRVLVQAIYEYCRDTGEREVNLDKVVDAGYTTHEAWMKGIRLLSANKHLVAVERNCKQSTFKTTGFMIECERFLNMYEEDWKIFEKSGTELEGK